MKTQNESVDGVHMHLENPKISWMFFWFLCVMYTVVYMTKNCYGAAMASIVDAGILTKSQTGFITSAFYLVYTPLQILGGMAADRYNPEKMVMIGLLGGGIANTVIAINQNYYVMLAAWIFNAIIQAPLWSSIFKIMTSQLLRSARKSMAFYMSFAPTAGLILVYLLAAVVKEWQHNFVFSAVMLFAFAALLWLGYKFIKPYMVPDTEAEPVRPAEEKKPQHKIGTVRLFWISGFLCMMPVVLIRSMVEQGIKTLSPTMLMESYAEISPTLGNLLGTIIMIAGVLGTILVRKVLYPRYIRDEVVGYLILIAATLPFMAVICFVGKIPALLIVGAMFAVILILTATHLLTSYFNMNFEKYGKNGAAAGYANAAASFGIVVYSSGFTMVAERFSWVAVAYLIIAFLLTAMAFATVALVQWRKFQKNEK